MILLAKIVFDVWAGLVIGWTETVHRVATRLALSLEDS